jgi:hypothetical protein
MERLLSKRWIWWLPLALGLVPAWMAWRFTCEVPHADHWAVVVQPWLAWRDGAPAWATLHQRMNDSRLDVPNLLHVLLVRLDHWNLRMESLACVLIACGTVGVVVWLFRNCPPCDRARSWVLALISAALILSPHAWMNWTFGVQTCYAIVVFLTVSMVALFQTGLPLVWRSLLAGLCAGAAVHSFLNGWIAWPLGSLCLVHAVRRTKVPRRSALAALAIWVLLFALTAALFFPGFKSAASAASGIPPMMDQLVHEPAAVVRYFASVLGAPLAEGWVTGDRELRRRLTAALAPVMAAGLLLLWIIISLALRRQRRWEKGAFIFPYMILALWGLMNAAAVAAGRTGVVASDPFQSRYLAFTIWFHIGLLALLFAVEGRFWRWLRSVCLLVGAYGYVVGFVQGLSDARRDYQRNQIMAAACALRHVAPEPAALDALWPTAGRGLLPLVDRLDELGMLHVSTVRDELSSAGARSDSAFGAIEEGKVLAPGVFLRGWAIELPSRDMADAVVISFQREGEPEKWLGLAQRRVSRPKPAQKHRSIAMEDRVGWEYQTPTGTAGPAHSSGAAGFRSKSLPSGKVTFRAYAFDLRSGTFSPLEGCCALEIP